MRPQCCLVSDFTRLQSKIINYYDKLSEHGNVFFALKIGGTQ
jgi:hypothetical protein